MQPLADRETCLLETVEITDLKGLTCVFLFWAANPLRKWRINVSNTAA